MKTEDKITEQPSHFDHLEQMSVKELLQHINEEDALVAGVVHKAIPQIEALVEAVEPRMKQGGRLFYVGAGTSGRLGVLDASELPPPNRRLFLQKDRGKKPVQRAEKSSRFQNFARKIS